MKSKVSLDHFKSNPDLVKSYIADSASKDVSRIEYRTFDEGMCDATIFTIHKNNIEDEFEAFITLLNYQLHFTEEWMISHASVDNADSILEVWLQPEVEGFSFKDLTAEQVHKEVDWIIEAIQRHIVQAQRSGKMKHDPGRWGVYVNNEKMPIETSLCDLEIAGIVSGIGLSLEWNSVDVMYETDKCYVFFSWGTGA